MRPSSSSDNDTRRGQGRPTLPPIRDLFREELSQSVPPRMPANSPHVSLSHLRVSDDEYNPPSMSDYTHSRGLMGPGSWSSRPDSSPRLSSSTSQSSYQSMSTLSNSRSNPDPRTLSASRPLPSEARESQYANNPYPTRMSNASISSDQHYTPSVPDMYSRDSRDPRNMLHPQADPSRTGGSYDPRTRSFSDVHSHQGLAPITSNRADWGAQEVAAPASSASKYECSYCGKGFNRPSSLKIHLNSHTGEKPFVCPVEGCGRSFSVLSNMRRHARVHTQTPRAHHDGSSDDGSDPSPGSSGSPTYPPYPAAHTSASGSGRVRESSVASTSPQARSKTPSPESKGHPEKWSHHHQQ